MRALLIATMMLTTMSGAALAESEQTPAPAPVEATPTPLPEATPVPVPTGSTVISAPAWSAAAAEKPPVAPRPPRDPLGWEIEAVVNTQGVFDGGIHVFSEDSFLSGAELRVRKTMPGAMSRFSASPELSYGVAHATRLYPGAATTELWMQRFQAGGRASMAIDRFPAIRPVARAGATGLWGTALAHDSYRDHREEAFGFGAYLSGGLEMDLGQAFRVLEPQQHLTFGLEAGHLYSSGLAFGRMGELDVNGVFWSAQLGFRF